MILHKLGCNRNSQLWFKYSWNFILER